MGVYETVVRGRMGQLLNCETRLARTDVLTALCWSHIQYSVAYHKQMHATEYESCFSLCNNWSLSVMRETTQLSLSLSHSLPEGVEETRETREKMGIMVHYNVKVRCVVSFGK